MKLLLQQKKELNEVELEIKYPDMTQRISKLVQFIKQYDLEIGLTRKQINKNVEKYNGLFEIEHLLHKKVETLSYGQKRIVATFIGMVCGSKCIVLDEVTEGLDVETKLILSRMLREIKKEKIVILVSHDLEFIETCNDYNIFIKNGKIIEVNERTQDLRTIYDQYILATEGD